MGELPALVLLGIITGLLLVVASGEYVETLLYGVKISDWATVAAPTVMLGVAPALASLPPVLRAVRTDPAQTLRSE